VWRLQRSLRAAGGRLGVTGVYDTATDRTVRAYRAARGLPTYRTTDAAVWAELQRGQTL
jgi:peptidoglycan hydrolase-like protein with peptidoglycan-binding domain